MRTRIRTTGCALLGAAVATAALAAPAGAAPKFQSASFKVSIKGVQNLKWAYNHPDGGTCDVSYTGGGTEKLVFKSKPVTVNAFMAPGEKRPVLVSDGASVFTLPATAKLTRESGITLGPGGLDDLDCPGGGSGGETPKDCGTKTVSPYKFQLYYDYVQKDRINVGPTNTPDPFANCPGAGNGFPYLFTDDINDSKRKLPKLPPSELFDEEIGKIIVLGKGTRKINDPEFTANGKVEWDLTFKRLKGKPKA